MRAAEPVDLLFVGAAHESQEQRFPFRFVGRQVGLQNIDALAGAAAENGYGKLGYGFRHKILSFMRFLLAVDGVKSRRPCIRRRRVGNEIRPFFLK